MRVSRAWRIGAAGLLAAGLAGCATDGTFSWPSLPAFAGTPPGPPGPPGPPPPPPGPPASPPTTLTVQDPGDVKYYPSDTPLKLGVEHFNRGHYGIAERYFRDAVELAPRDATAWVGLAASYDRIGRFDLADRAYRSAIRLTGITTDILNNLGYSYMLRGDYVRARQKFLQAYARDPGNPTVINNLQLLDQSTKYIERNPDAVQYDQGR
jgi:tetratricopeptide (TPR) repeat protein